jgi:hypothetical protein
MSFVELGQAKSPRWGRTLYVILIDELDEFTTEELSVLP